MQHRYACGGTRPLVVIDPKLSGKEQKSGRHEERLAALKFVRACEDLYLYHDTATLSRSEANEVAERAVRKVKEETASVLL